VPAPARKANPVEQSTDFTKKKKGAWFEEKGEEDFEKNTNTGVLAQEAIDGEKSHDYTHRKGIGGKFRRRK